MATPNGRTAIHVQKGREEGRERKGRDSLCETFKCGTHTKLKKKMTRDSDSVQANRKKAEIEWDISSSCLTFRAYTYKIKKEDDKRLWQCAGK